MKTSGRGGMEKKRAGKKSKSIKPWLPTSTGKGLRIPKTPVDLGAKKRISQQEGQNKQKRQTSRGKISL